MTVIVSLNTEVSMSMGFPGATKISEFTFFYLIIFMKWVLKTVSTIMVITATGYRPVWATKRLPLAWNRAAMNWLLAVNQLIN